MDNLKAKSKKELIEKIISKKEFNNLPIKDVEKVFAIYDKPHLIDSEKVKMTRDLLRKMYTAFVSSKILTVKDKNFEWFLSKHISTKERMPYYEEVYSRLLKEFDFASVIDLGAGINGLSFEYFEKINKKVDYLAIEAVGQLVNQTNNYFKQNKLKAKAKKISLFDLKSVTSEIKKMKKPRVVFLFKTLDSLEMAERDYSKKLVDEISKNVSKIVVSFATKSLVAKKRFNVRRNWFYNFLKDNYSILDEFEVGSEKYIIFKKK